MRFPAAKSAGAARSCACTAYAMKVRPQVRSMQSLIYKTQHTWNSARPEAASMGAGSSSTGMPAATAAAAEKTISSRAPHVVARADPSRPETAVPCHGLSSQMRLLKPCRNHAPLREQSSVFGVALLGTAQTDRTAVSTHPAKVLSSI